MTMKDSAPPVCTRRQNRAYAYERKWKTHRVGARAEHGPREVGELVVRQPGLLLPLEQVRREARHRLVLRLRVAPSRPAQHRHAVLAKAAREEEEGGGEEEKGARTIFSFTPCTCRR